jgi:hypothetical protein
LADLDHLKQELLDPGCLEQELPNLDPWSRALTSATGRHKGWVTSAYLLEKDVPFQIQPVDLSKDEHKSLSFLKLQPFLARSRPSKTISPPCLVLLLRFMY